MIESLLKSTYFWFKGWHYHIGKSVCGPMEPLLRIRSDLIVLVSLMAYLRPLSWSSCAHPSLPVGQITYQVANTWPSIHPSTHHRLCLCLSGNADPDSVMARLLWLAQFEFVRDSAAWLFLGSGWWVGLIVLTLNSAA